MSGLVLSSAACAFMFLEPPTISAARILVNCARDVIIPRHCAASSLVGVSIKALEEPPVRWRSLSKMGRLKAVQEIQDDDLGQFSQISFLFNLAKASQTLTYRQSFQNQLQQKHKYLCRPKQLGYKLLEYLLAL